MTISQRFVDVRPELVRQLHPTKNAHLDLTTLLLYSNKMATWICEKQHEWPASIANRSNGTGCPYCKGKKVCLDNCLATLYPEIASQWHPKNKLTPYDYTAGSNKDAWWQCDKGHVWPTQIWHRTIRGTGCPYCANQKIDKSNCLATLYPELMKEWDYEKNGSLNPYEIGVNIITQAYWRCKYGHSWPTRIAHRVNGSGCPRCNKQDSKLQLFFYCELKAFYNDVEYRKKIDGVECDIYLPQFKIAIEIDALRWHRNRLEQDQKKYGALVHLGVRLIAIRENGLEQISPYTVRYQNHDDKLGISKKLMALLCSLTNDERLQGYRGLVSPINEAYYFTEAARHPAPLVENSLAVVNPELAKEWDYEANGALTPYDVYPNSSYRIRWRCIECGHRWPAILSNRHDKNTGCPDCWAIRRNK
jgi:hypothetical protein